MTGQQLRVVEWLTPSDIWEPLTLDLALSLKRGAQLGRPGVYTTFVRGPEAGPSRTPWRDVTVLDWHHVVTVTQTLSADA